MFCNAHMEVSKDSCPHPVKRFEIICNAEYRFGARKKIHAKQTNRKVIRT